MSDEKLTGAALYQEALQKVDESAKEDFTCVLSVAIKDIEKRESHVANRMEVLSKKKARLESLKAMDIGAFRKYIKERRKKHWRY